MVKVNTTMAKKIIQTRRQSDIGGISSIGGASGITNMLSRGKNKVKPMNFSQQKNSINRLYAENHKMTGITLPESDLTQNEQRQKLKELHAKLR